MANKRIKGITIQIGGDTVNLAKSLKDVTKTSVNLNSELHQINRQLKLDPSSSVLLAQKQKVLAESIENSKEKLKKLEAVQQDIERAYKKGEIDDGQYRAYQREIEETKSKLESYEKELNQAGKVQESFDKKLDSARATLEKNKDTLKQGAKNVVKWGTALTAAAGGAGLAVLKYASDFETSFAKVSTLLDGSEIDLDKYKQSILDLSNEIGLAATDTANAVYDAISAGVKAEDAVEFVKKAYKLAKGGFTELSKSADIITTIKNAYQMDIKDVDRIMDVLINTQNKGKVFVGEFSQYMGKSIPVAESYNVSLENLATGYAVLTSRGIKAASATTYQKSLFEELAKSSKGAGAEIYNLTGKNFADLMSEGKSVADVLEILYKSVNYNNTAFGALFSKSNARSAALSLMKAGVKKFNKELKSMKNSTGAAEEAYGKMTNTASHKVEKLKVNLQNTAISIGEGLLPVANDFLEEVERHLPEIQQMAKDLGTEIGNDAKWVIQNGGTIIKIIKAVGIEAGGIYAAVKANQAVKYIGGTISAIQTLTKATEAAKVAQVGLNTAQKANVIGAVVSGLIILGTTIWNVCDATGVFSKDTSQLTEEQKKLIDSIHEEHEALKETRESRKKNVSEIESEYQYYESLYDELDKIVDKNGKVKKGEEERAKFITDTLGEALGIEFKWNDKILKNYKNQKKALKELIQTQRNKAFLAAYEQDYEKSKKDSLANETNLFDAQTNYENAKKQRDEWQNRINKLTPKVLKLQKKISSGNIQNGDYTSEDESKLSLYSSEIGELNQKLSRGKSDFQKLKDAYFEAYENYISGNTLIKNYEKASEAIISNDEKKIKKWLSLLKNDFVTAGNDTSESMERILRIQKESAENRYKELKKANKKGVKGITQEMVDEANVYKEKATKELKNFYNNLNETNNKKHKEAVAKEKENAEEHGDAITSINSKSNKKKAKERASDLYKTLKGGLEGLRKGFYNLGFKSGKSYSEGYKEGVLSGVEQAAQAGAAVAAAALEGTRKKQDSKSPSKKARKLGRDNGAGYALGIEDKMSDAVKAAQKTTTEVLSQLSSAASGSNIIVGSSLTAAVSDAAINSEKTRIQKKTLNNSTVINPVVRIGTLTVRSDRDIDDISDAVSAKIAAQILREGGSMGE